MTLLKGALHGFQIKSMSSYVHCEKHKANLNKSLCGSIEPLTHPLSHYIFESMS
jgi:hypothetical protein